MKQVPEFSPFASRGGFPSGRYLMVQGKDKGEAYLVSDAFTEVSTDPNHWIEKEFLKIEKPKEISMAHSKSDASFKLIRDTENGEFKLEGAKSSENLDPSIATSLASSLASLRFSEIFAKPGSKQAELEKATVVQIKTFDGFQYTLRLAKKEADEKYFLQVMVNAELPKERVPGKDEKPEDKDRLDKEFKEHQEKLQQKRDQEKEFEGWIYRVDQYAVDSILKERKDLMKKKEEVSKSEAKSESKPASVSKPKKKS